MFKSFYTLEQNIRTRLKTFSELKRKYDIGDNIYRSGERKYFSKRAQKYNLHGCPLDRPTCHLSVDYYENTENDRDIYEPVWYASDIEASKDYCIGVPDCTTYSYTPRDISKEKKIKLVFLDLTGPYLSNLYLNHSDEVVKKYKMDETFMRQIYDYIENKYADQIMDDNDGNGKHLCVDNPCENIFVLDRIRSAYGYYGFRNSEYAIDRFFTLELLHIISELEIEKTCNCKVLGYYHAYLVNGDFDEVSQKPIIDIYSYMSSEFVIKYNCSINKNYIHFNGEVSSYYAGSKLKKNKKKMQKGTKRNKKYKKNNKKNNKNNNTKKYKR
jgi:hypothetical protein